MTVTYKEKHEKTRKNTKIIKLKDCFSHFSCLVTFVEDERYFSSITAPFSGCIP